MLLLHPILAKSHIAISERKRGDRHFDDFPRTLRLCVSVLKSQYSHIIHGPVNFGQHPLTREADYGIMRSVFGTWCPEALWDGRMVVKRRIENGKQHRKDSFAS